MNAAPNSNSFTGANGSNISVTAPENLLVNATATAALDTVSVTPTLGKLAGKTRYTVQLAPAIADTSGRTLGSSFSWSFTTQQEVFTQVATEISRLNDLQMLYRPLSAIDDAGNVFVVWFDSQSSGNFYGLINYQFYNAATGLWSPAATTIQTSPIFQGAVIPFSLTSVPGGEPVLMWGGYLPDNSLVLFQSTFQMPTAGAVTFTAPTVTPLIAESVSNTPNANASVYANGMLAAAAKNNATVTAALFNPQTQVWGPVQQIATNAVNSAVIGFDNLAMAADANGAVTLVYCTGGHLMATTRAASATSWPAPAQLDTLASGSITQFVATGGASGTFVAWSQTPTNGVPAIKSVRLALAATSWTAPTQLDDGLSPTGADSPSITIDRAGSVSVAYSQPSTNTIAPTDGLYLARFNPTSATWSSPARASPPAVGGGATAPGIVADQAGNVLVVYRVGHQQAWSQYLSSTGVIDMAPIFDFSGVAFGFANDASVVIDRNNEATAVWYLDGSPNQVRADRFQ